MNFKNLILNFESSFCITSNSNRWMRYSIFLLFLLSANIGFSQTVSGIVQDAETNEPLIGATIMIQGTANGVTTDVDGNFELNADVGSSLLISYTGYDSKVVEITGIEKLIISLTVNSAQLEEVVVIGYGRQKKKVSTGAISSVGADELDGYQIPNVQSALDGQVSGVIINSQSGQPGSNKNIFIRGISTNGDNTPLFVVDGFVGADINNINPADIESMDVLKDAASTAIYGARAANGVIIITTKTGDGGKPSLNYESYFASSDVWRMPEMLNSAEYVGLIREKYVNNGAAPPGNFPTTADGLPDTDWMDAIFNSAPTMSHRLSATMGSTYLSLEYWDESGIVGGDKSNFQRYNARLNGNKEITDWLSLSYMFNVTRKQNKNIGVNNQFGSVMADAFYIDPITDLWDVNNPDLLRYGFAQSEWGHVNPLSRLFLENGKNHSDHMLGRINLTIEPIENLKFNSSIGGEQFWYRYDYFTPDYDFIPTFASNTITYGQGSGNGSNVQLENYLDYSYKTGEHNFDFILGTSYQQNNFESLDAQTLDVSADVKFDESFQLINGIADSLDRVTGNRNVEYRILSTYARLIYDYDSKYLFSATLRRDGSSNFGVNNRFGVFPAFSLGWVVSEESFFPKGGFLDFFKLRTSWGVNGNDRIAPLSYEALIVPGAAYTFGNGENVATGATVQTLPNPNIKWEESVQFDIGFDASLMEGKINVEFDFFNKITRDLLGGQIIPRYTGVTQDPISNLGEFRNRGIETGIKYRENFGGLKFNVALNYTTYKNVVTKIPGTTAQINGVNWSVRNTPITRMEEGLPVGHFVGYTTLGIFNSEGDVVLHANENGDLLQPDAQPGDLILEDTNGDGVINTDDFSMIGSPWPDHIIGLNLNMEYKGFDLSMLWSTQIGHDIFRAYESTTLRVNYQKWWLQRWTPENTDTDIPRVTTQGSNLLQSDFYVEDGSFLRLRNFQIGYTLPDRLLNRINVQAIRVYFSGNNLVTLTNYRGFDPEVGTNGWVLDTGIDRIAYPVSRSLGGGIKITL